MEDGSFHGCVLLTGRPPARPPFRVSEAPLPASPFSIPAALRPSPLHPAQHWPRLTAGVGAQWPLTKLPVPKLSLHCKQGRSECFHPTSRMWNPGSRVCLSSWSQALAIQGNWPWACVFLVRQADSPDWKPVVRNVWGCLRHLWLSQLGEVFGT